MAQDRFTVSLTGGILTEPKVIGFNIKREADAAVLVAGAFGGTGSYKENTPGRTAANSVLLKKIRELYNADIYKKALAVANEQGLEAVPAFMGTYFSDQTRDVEVATMTSFATEDMKPKPAPAKKNKDGTPATDGGTAPAPVALPGTPPMAQPA